MYFQSAIGECFPNIQVPVVRALECCEAELEEKIGAKNKQIQKDLLAEMRYL